MLRRLAITNTIIVQRSGEYAECSRKSGETLPALVVCNVDWDSMEQAGLSDGQQQIQSAFETYGVKDYVVLQKGNVKIAVVGVFGTDALKCAPTCELIFKTRWRLLSKL